MIPRLYGPDVTSLVLTEDASFGNTILKRNVHVLSTRPFLATLEELGIIPSATVILKDIAVAGRRLARYQADRPAVALGAARELTGRPTFRLCGL
jgi:hypothetical protein